VVARTFRRSRTVPPSPLVTDRMCRQELLVQHNHFRHVLRHLSPCKSPQIRRR
jgi:hypothetical protein